MLLVATCNSSYFILQTGVYGTTSISDSKAKGTCGQPVNPESILHLPTLKQATHLTSLWPHENSRPSRATKMDAKHHPTNDTNGSSWSIWEIWWSKKQFDCPVPLVPYNMVAKLHQLNTHTHTHHVWNLAKTSLVDSLKFRGWMDAAWMIENPP